MRDKSLSPLSSARLDHIGIAVNDLDTAVENYRLLGIEPDPREIIADQGVEVQPLQVGESRLELLQPLSDDSPVARFIKERGEGLHHIALRVNNIRDTLSHCKAGGMQLLDEEPRTGAGGTLIAFLHPHSTGGVLIELVQESGDENPLQVR